MISEQALDRRSTAAHWLLDAITVLTGTYLLAISARMRVSLPFTPVPVTGQTAVVLLIGALLGWRRGVLSTSCYLLAGGLGLPLFAGGAIAGPTGGYLVGFIAAAGMVGWLRERGWGRRPLAAGLVLLFGNICIYLVGLPWLATFVGIHRVLPLGLYPFVFGDLVKIISVTVILTLIQRRRRSDLTG
jgi:biotin transport system substrate-specific component